MKPYTTPAQREHYWDTLCVKLREEAIAKSEQPASTFKRKRSPPRINY